MVLAVQPFRRLDSFGCNPCTTSLEAFFQDGVYHRNREYL